MMARDVKVVVVLSVFCWTKRHHLNTDSFHFISGYVLNFGDPKSESAKRSLAVIDAQVTQQQTTLTDPNHPDPNDNSISHRCS